MSGVSAVGMVPDEMSGHGRGTRDETLAADHLTAVEARNLKVTAICLDLLEIASRFGAFDPACDRLLDELCRQTRWIAQRTQRNAQ